MDDNGHFALIEIKSNIRTTTPTSPVPPFIDIENNNLLDFYKIGVALTRSRKCNVINNIFTPRADSTNYVHVWINSKQRTAGSAASQPPLAVIETVIQGNQFNGNNVFGGYGIAYQNANTNATGKVFSVNDIGGAGSLANTFGANIAKVAYLDTVSGGSGQNSFWSNPGINWTVWPSTPMSPIQDNFDFSENLYDLGTGSKRPSAMTASELLQLENRVVHKIDVDTIGFVTMKPNHVFVTQASFLAPLTTSARIQRAIHAAGAVDGFTVNIETGAYMGETTVSQDMIFDATPDGEISTTDLGMNGSGKSLLLSDPIRITETLRLQDGLIDISSNNLTMEATASVSGGSLTSHVLTSGVGYFVNENLSATPKRFAIGTGTKYAETQIANLGTSDDIGLKAFNDVFSGGLTGTIEDTVVSISYQIKESVVGGSNLTFSPTWDGSNERQGFDRNVIYVEQFNGSWQNVGPVAATMATGTDPYTVSADITGNWSDQPVRLSSTTEITLPGNLYYVDDVTGLDSRTNDEAKNPLTPWKTIANSLAKTDNGDSIQVFDGNYSENNLRILKSVKLFGNEVGIGTGPGAGDGNKPRITGIDLNTDSTMIYVQAPNVEIVNFQIEVNQSTVIHGIYGRNGNFNNLRVIRNNIFSVSPQQTPGLPCVVFNSYGMRFLNGGTDSVIIKGNFIRPMNIPDHCAFGRGIRGFSGGRFIIGGPMDSDSNTIAAFYGVQLGAINGMPSIIQNNAIAGNCIEINTPAANTGIHQVINNRMFAGIPQAILALVELKNIQAVGTGVNIEGNRFFGHSNIGLLSTRSQNVTASNNLFIPADTAKNFRHIHVNTKQQTTSINQPPVPNGIMIKGNEYSFLGLIHLHFYKLLLLMLQI